MQKAYNKPMTAAERKQFEADNLRRLHAKIALAYKFKAELFGFVEVEELPQTRSQKRKMMGVQIQPFAINLKDVNKRIGYYELFLPNYKEAVKTGKMPYINPNHFENYLPTKKTA